MYSPKFKSYIKVTRFTFYKLTFLKIGLKVYGGKGFTRFIKNQEHQDRVVILSVI